VPGVYHLSGRYDRMELIGEHGRAVLFSWGTNAGTWPVAPPHGRGHPDPLTGSGTCSVSPCTARAT
jgi:hypothetical protein